MTEKLLKRRNTQLVIFEYLRKSRRHSHKITDIANALQLQTVNVRIMHVLTQLADLGLISFICEGKRGSGPSKSFSLFLMPVGTIPKF
jgi:Mn-dependent DtxR family transcriptional regulator